MSRAVSRSGSNSGRFATAAARRAMKLDPLRASARCRPASPSARWAFSLNADEVATGMGAPYAATLPKPATNVSQARLAEPHLRAVRRVRQCRDDRKHLALTMCLVTARGLVGLPPPSLTPRRADLIPPSG